MKREPHVYTPAQDPGRGMVKPENWRDILLLASLPPSAFPLMTHPQPDTAERTRLAVQSIPFALPEKRDE